MLLRVSTLRGLVLLTVVSTLVYTILLRRSTPTASSATHVHKHDELSRVLVESKGSISIPAILVNSPLHDELVDIQFEPMR